jgi:hypothetical protein
MIEGDFIATTGIEVNDGVISITHTFAKGDFFFYEAR